MADEPPINPPAIDSPDVNVDFASWTAHQWAQLAPTADSSAALVAIRYIRIADLLSQSHSAALKPFKKSGITSIADFRILGLLRHVGSTGIDTQRIAEHLAFDPSTVSNRLNRLERHGHIQRLPHPSSRRSHLVTLDPQSDSLVDEMYKALVRNHENFFRALSPEEHQVLGDLLGRLT